MLNIKDLYIIFQAAGKIDEYQKILELIDDINYTGWREISRPYEPINRGR